MTHLRAVGLVVALLAASEGRAPLNAQGTDESALRRRAEEFLAESRARPRREFLSGCGLPVPAAGGVETGWLQASSVALLPRGGDDGVVRLEVTLAPDAPEGETKGPSNPVPLNLRFVREGDGWRRTGCRPAEADLADALLASATVEGRRSLLDAETVSVTQRVAGVLQEQGTALRVKGEIDGALVRYERALEVAQLLSDSKGAAAALRGLGAVALEKGEYAQALTHARRSLAIAETIGDTEATAAVLSNLGWIHFVLADHTEALLLVQRSLALEEKAGHEAHVIPALGALGSIHTELGDYASGLAAFERARRLAEKAGETTRLLTVLNNLGVLYNKQGDPPQALRHLREALRMAEESGNRAWASILMFNVGMTLVDAGENEEAVRILERGVRLADELGMKARRAEALMAMGSAHQKGGRRALARGAYEQSLPLMQEMGRRAEAAGILNELGEMALTDGEPADALARAEEATGLAGEIGSPELLRQARTIAGRARLASGRTEEARRSFEQAIAATERLRTDVAGGEHGLSAYFENRLAPYHGMVELLVGEGRRAPAFEYAERAKGRVLLDALQKGRASVSAAMTAEEREKKRALTASLASLNQQVAREAESAQPDSTRLTDLKESRERVRLESEAFEASIYSAHPELRARRGEVAVLGKEALERLVPDGETAFVEYAVAEERTYSFVLSRSARGAPLDIDVFTIPVPKRELAARVGRFRALLAERSPAFAGPASELFDLLLRPAEGRLRGRTRMGIVPDGPLWELPFQALRRGPDRYVLDDRSVFYVPSLSVLALMTQRAERAGRETRGALLALGNPDLGEETVARVRSLHGDARLRPLPEAEKEVRALRGLYGTTSRVYTGAEATEARVKAEAGSYRILHLATHGILDDASPLFSHVVLSRAAGPSEEDGVLEAREILGLDLSADLAVLSACQTGRGRVRPGEGVIGMSWALFVAGCPSAVVSQWEVDSASTTRLMLEFHRNLSPRPRGAGLTPADALRRAALALRAGDASRHPYYWAGFVVVGRDAALAR